MVENEVIILVISKVILILSMVFIISINGLSLYKTDMYALFKPS